MMGPACPHHDQTAGRTLLGEAWTSPILHADDFSSEQTDVLVYRASLPPLPCGGWSNVGVHQEAF